ncbi:MAG: hypothetical protein ACK5M3_16100, partial [Dysgonomonas sp.]
FFCLGCGEYVDPDDPEGTYMVYDGNSTSFRDVVYTVVPYKEGYWIREGISTYGNVVYTIRSK